MTHSGKARTALKRGSLIAAANWQVVVIQSVAETTFKLLLAIPIVGGAFLVTTLLGKDLEEVLAGDLRQVLLGVAGTLVSQPLALIIYIAGLLLVLAGGSILMFGVKGGTVSVLVHADRTAGPVERPPLRIAAFRRAMGFSIDAFTGGAADLFKRYLVLGVILTGLYALAASVCLLLGYGLYCLSGARPLLLGSVAAFALVIFVAMVTVINVLYLLAQIIVAVGDGGVGWSMREVARFVRGEFWKLLRVFGVTVVLLILAMIFSLAATWGFYLIAYVPLAGLVVLPLQFCAWLLRSIVFQYLGLTALAAYLSLYRSFAGDRQDGTAVPASR